MAPIDRLREQFRALLSRFAAAIEYWTAACLTRDWGNPQLYVEEQWRRFQQELHEIRETLVQLPSEPPPVVHEQVAKLMRLAADLWDVFQVFIAHDRAPREELERAVLKLGSLWKELRLRVTLAAAMTPLPAPLPAVSSDDLRRLEAILDGLFDRLAAGERL